MKLFQIKSPKVGRILTVSAQDVLSFYNEHVLGNVEKFQDKVIRRLRAEKQKLSLPIVGTVLVELFDIDNELAAVNMGGNLVVDTGRSAAIDRLQAAAVAVHDYVAIGTSSTAAAAGDTALIAETGTRVQGTLTQPTAYTDRVVSTFAAGNGTATIAETGRLNASTTGNLFARYVFTGIPKGADDSLQITYDITV